MLRNVWLVCLVFFFPVSWLIIDFDAMGPCHKQQIKTAQNDDLRSRRALFTPQSCKLLAFEGQSFLSVASSQTMKGCLVSRADGLQ